MGQNPYPVEIADSGGGPVKTAGDLTFTDPGNQPGGSSPLAVRVPIAFNTPDLVLTGITLYTPTIGDVLLDYVSCYSVETAWNGSTPFLWLSAGGDDYATLAVSGKDLTQVDIPNGARTGLVYPFATDVLGGAGQQGIFTSADPLVATVDDTAGGDPGSTQGAGEIILVILPAT
jgi:hypothetical protein